MPALAKDGAEGRGELPGTVTDQEKADFSHPTGQ
jgi:hypothetical protein